MEITRTDCKSETLFSQMESLATDFENVREWMMNHVTVHGGLAVGSNTKRFALAADTHYILAGKNYKKAAADDIAQPASTNDASQFSKDLISVNASGTITVTAGTKAASQNAAERPNPPEGDLALGWIEVPNSFTPGTTDVTSGMLKHVNYDLDWTLETSVEEEE